MSKFQPLSERLAGHTDDEWRASFAEIEETLGFPLPKAARSGGAWWGKQGFTAKADAKSGEVVFRRGDISPAAMQAVLDAPEAEPQREPQNAVVTVPGEPARVVPTAKGWGLAAAVAGGVALLVGAGVVASKALSRRA
jgi:hypothetical protein